MNTRATLAIFVVAALALLAAIAVDEKSAPIQAEHDQFEALMDQEHAVDGDTARHALESRFGFDANYDELAKNDRERRGIERGLEQGLPNFLRPAERQALRRAMSKHKALSDQRELLLERFKSENALFRNSRGFFPSAAAAALLQTRDPELVDEINEIRGLVLSLAMQDDALAKETYRKSVAKLVAASPAKLSTSATHLVDLMLAHAQAIVLHKASTDQLLRELLALPFDSAESALENAYARAFARAQNEHRLFGHFVSGMSVLLLAIVAFAGLRLQNAAVGLGRANERLEVAVAERTAELEAELKRRAHMELELRQAQKLEAVGQLASGIAHEINTPIQYVGDSVYFLRHAFADVMRLVDAYRAAVSRIDPTQQTALETREDVDVELLRVEVPEAFERTADGTRQVASIVKAMKTFAHTSVDKAPVDLNAALENTLTVARNEYKYVADLVTELGEIPPVTCNAGGIRQVLLNLIVNAAHAIADRAVGTEARGTICIKTACRDTDVLISIADTGRGIPEAIRERIFEPFFTTKEPGRGTGQGLAISRSIVTQHGGKLWFETELDRGTTFFMQLPVESTDTAAQRTDHAA